MEKKFEGIKLKRQAITRQSDKQKRRDSNVVFLLQFFDGNTVHIIRTNNVARALTVLMPYCESHYLVQISVWIRVGEQAMIPLNYTASNRESLIDSFNTMASDIANSMSTQVDNINKRKEHK